MIYTIEEMEDAIEVIFDNLDISKFETSYVDVVGYGEPNEMFKMTPDDKKGYLQDVVYYMLEKIKSQLK